MNRRDRPTSPMGYTAMTFIYRRTRHHYDDNGEFAWFTALIETPDGRVLAEINGASDYIEALDKIYDEANKMDPPT